MDETHDRSPDLRYRPFLYSAFVHAANRRMDETHGIATHAQQVARDAQRFTEWRLLIDSQPPLTMHEAVKQIHNLTQEIGWMNRVIQTQSDALEAIALDRKAERDQWEKAR